MKRAIYLTALLVTTSLFVTGCKNHSQIEVLANQEEQAEEFVVTSNEIKEVKQEELILDEEDTLNELLMDYEYKADDLWVVKIYNPLTEKEEYHIMTQEDYSYKLNNKKAKEEKEKISNLIKLVDEEIQLVNGSYCFSSTFTSIFDESIKIQESTMMICCWNDISLCHFSKDLFDKDEVIVHNEYAFADGIKSIENYTNNYYKDTNGTKIVGSDYVVEKVWFYDYYGCKLNEKFSRDELKAMERDLNANHTIVLLKTSWCF